MIKALDRKQWPSKNLLPGDTILADRGFDIKDSVLQANMSIPAFTRGKTQLDAIEVEHTRQIANVCIHVERLNGIIHNKYLLLSATQPIDYVINEDENTVPTRLCMCVVV